MDAAWVGVAVTGVIAIVGWVVGAFKHAGEKRAQKRADQLQQDRDDLARRLVEAQEKIASLNQELLEAARQQADSAEKIAVLKQDESNRFRWEIVHEKGAVYRVTNKSNRVAYDVWFTTDNPMNRPGYIEVSELRSGGSFEFMYWAAAGPDFNYDMVIKWKDEFGNSYERAERFSKEHPTLITE
ncbi:hypothetical protein [Corynebacterium singulare]|nr:hypothetical protein [Corynebacterium singulare]